MVVGNWTITKKRQKLYTSVGGVNIIKIIISLFYIGLCTITLFKQTLYIILPRIGLLGVILCQMTRNVNVPNV